MELLPLPKSITTLEADGNRALFAIEPLYPGYGTTVGNALRRVLLSSLPGGAITAVSMENVSHEFSSIPGVKEDAVDIILNLKQIRLKLHTDGPVELQLDVHGAKTVTAGDITKNAGAEVMNPDQIIATLTEKSAKLVMTLTANSGRGYVPVENREKEKLGIGTIAIDAVYTPVRTVNFRTEHVRVEQMTNFDKLLLDITTDGTIDPAEALKQATNILVDHFAFIRDGLAAAPVVEVTEESETPKKKRSKKAESEETPA